ncbi:osteoclast stimulatory transmembrane protein-like [Pristis pectinata]|uniref:osteoclast stimulatory transmembrane protein-like n=1 Tax=Pristis pectinata TaxID=685728 RepID=UPI00223E5812|nr:osteoclast stimulatory transmembrane protein-like [Pristis pectinata]
MPTCINCANSLHTWKVNVQRQPSYIWSIFSKPTPRNVKELFILLLFCLSIAGAAGSSLFYWMSHTLQFKEDVSGIFRGSFTAVLLVLLFLVHPVRCLFTLIIPTLITQQGQKILLSGCCLLIVTNIIPNIIQNIKMVLEVNQCIMWSTTEGILNFVQFAPDKMLTEGMSSMARFITSAFIKIQSSSTKTNLERVRNNLTSIGHKINRDFHGIQVWMDQVTLVLNRALAVIFFIYMIVTSAWYLTHYLTDLDFDNRYSRRRLEKLAKSRTTDCAEIRAVAEKLTKRTGLKLSEKEKKKCLINVAMITTYLLLSAVVVAADYGIFYLTGSLLEWTENAPPIPITIDFQFLGVNVWSFPWQYTLIPAQCVKQPVPPASKGIYITGGLFIMTYFMAVLDAYAVRIRRKVAASFFWKVEEERICYFYQKISEKYVKEDNGECLSTDDLLKKDSRQRGSAEQEAHVPPQGGQENNRTTGACCLCPCSRPQPTEFLQQIVY